MIMGWIWMAFLGISILCAGLTGNGAALSAAIPEGAQAGITLAISIAGSSCLWMGIGNLMKAAGLTDKLAKLLSPLLNRLFPQTRTNPVLAGCLSTNICANILGLGNAATPMGILAAKELAQKSKNGIASNELCRLVVLNTASIQLICTNVAAVRTSLGCAAPFDILPAVWITSICSAGAGLAAAWLLGKVWPDA